VKFDNDHLRRRSEEEYFLSWAKPRSKGAV